MRYAILGTGALGGLYGSLLAKAGQEVHFLARSDFEHIQEHGLEIESPWGDFHLPSVNVYRAAEDIPAVDVAIVAWKATQNEQLAQVLPAVCSDETLVLVLQNGYDIERSAAEALGADTQILGGCCFLCCNKTEPGKIQHLDYGKIAFGEYASSLRGSITDRMQRITAEFASAGIPMQESEDLFQTRWQKLMWNIPFNGLSVVLNADTKQLTTHPAALRLVQMLMTEVQQCASVCGYEIPVGFAEKLVRDTERMVPYDSSMALDYRYRRPIEVEAIFGNPLRAAVERGYHPAAVESLYRQLHYLNDLNLQGS
ncbi:MAG TPA: putative 2-dehydropantoate 2-reductase [Planctomycetaceae bacterium]|nr:putative 2-dehydropantoate 2-reductase [Planctomycetaceae bacterium]